MTNPYQKKTNSKKRSSDWQMLCGTLLMIGMMILFAIMSVGVRIGAEWAYGW